MIKKSRKKKEYDEDMPIGELTQIPDFLPPPDQLVFPKETVKITLELNKSSVDFFKRQAKQHHTKYQRMIREVIDIYARQYKLK